MSMVTADKSNHNHQMIRSEIMNSLEGVPYSMATINPYSTPSLSSLTFWNSPSPNRVITASLTCRTAHDDTHLTANHVHAYRDVTSLYPKNVDPVVCVCVCVCVCFYHGIMLHDYMTTYFWVSCRGQTFNKLEYIILRISGGQTNEMSESHSNGQSIVADFFRRHDRRHR